MISSNPGDDREGAFPFQRASVLVQRYKAVLLHDTLPALTDDLYPTLYYLNFFNSIGNISDEGKKIIIIITSQIVRAN